MTTSEFSVEFDTLYNNIKSQSAPGLDEYEKSVFLTKAQEELIKNYFNPTSNKLQQGFDGSEKRQIDFSELIRVASGTTNGTLPGIYESIDDRAQLYYLPADIFMIVNEKVVLLDSLTATTFKVVVLPLNYKEYDRLMSKPYGEPLKRQCWRLIQANNTSFGTTGQSAIAEIISRTNTVVQDYKIRYVKRPNPIILTSLVSNGLSINGISAISQCELSLLTHREILDRAVELAKLAYEDCSLQSTVQLNQRNE
jgi:hypothetical protein